MKKNKETIIYIATSCESNPGAGGYSLVIVDMNTYTMTNILYGGCAFTTPNRVDVEALRDALALRESGSLVIYIDSEYVLSTLSNIDKHQPKGFSGIGHSELWNKVFELMSSHEGWLKISDHSQFDKRDKYFYEIAVEHSRVSRVAEEHGIHFEETNNEASED